ncbi:phage tail protein I [Piscirickettsia litoralis]|uniref:Phage tail protein I n=1 Tax=Piscirickettsia litoralis TaxID=1891921 RepID=A0ABX2ZY59_9GAMM|nr:phage tail protein I [Piscirickettsia litoralis]ODN41163.1 phage tail protein I [Piscirickettsia litoralis]
MSKLTTPNATAIQIALDAAAEKVCVNDFDFSVLYHPYSCPLKFLPWLAQFVKVDYWDESWPEQRKRDVVANSLIVHRFKGTPYSIKTALTSVGIKANLLEWWKLETPKPFNFEVQAYVTQNDVTQDLLDRTYNAVVNSKRASDRFVLNLIAQPSNQLYIGSSVEVYEYRQVNVELCIPVEYDQPLFVGNAYEGLAIVEIDAFIEL